MKIRYESRHGIIDTRIPQIVDSDLATWTSGQERDVPDDLEIDVVVGGARLRAKAVDAILLSSPDFRDATTGLNPDFVCHECGRETLDVAYPHMSPTGAVTMTPYEDADGNKLCGHCYLVRVGPTNAAWTYHENVGSPLLAEAKKTIRDRADASAATAAAPAAPPARVAAPTPSAHVDEHEG